MPNGGNSKTQSNDGNSWANVTDDAAMPSITKLGDCPDQRIINIIEGLCARKETSTGNECHRPKELQDINSAQPYDSLVERGRVRPLAHM